MGKFGLYSYYEIENCKVSYLERILEIIIDCVLCRLLVCFPFFCLFRFLLRFFFFCSFFYFFFSSFGCLVYYFFFFSLPIRGVWGGGVVGELGGENNGGWW
jgi:hypothetical protein